MNYIEIIDQYKEEIVKSTQEIIRIKSVEGKTKPNMPFGEGPYKALEYALDLSKKLGFETKNLEGYAGYGEFGEGEETIGILVHLDVVPEGDGWTYPPYSGEIHSNNIYGRGAIDNKGPTIAVLYAMKALKESNITMNKKVRIIFGTNEETNWGCMKYYFENENPPTMAFTPDADFPVIHGEKGIIDFQLEQDIFQNETDKIKLISLRGGNAPNMVPDYAEIELEIEDIGEYREKIDKLIKENKDIDIELNEKIVKIKVKGVSAHGSTPQKGRNAISILMLNIERLFNEDNDVLDFVSIYNQRIGFKHNGEEIGCGYEDGISGKLTFNPGVIQYDEKKIKLTVNVRYPIKSSSEQVYDGIRENIKGTKLKLKEGEGDNKPLYVSKDNFLVKKLMEVYRKETGDFNSEPITIGGGTYARAMKNAVAFGPMFPGQKDIAHQKDEYISIDHLIKLTKIYAHALYELGK